MGRPKSVIAIEIGIKGPTMGVKEGGFSALGI
jgi:hypothetical protein